MFCSSKTLASALKLTIDIQSLKHHYSISGIPPMQEAQAVPPNLLFLGKLAPLELSCYGKNSGQ